MKNKIPITIPALKNKLETEENALINIAQNHQDDKIAMDAMKKLKEKYDPTYGWCSDCDGLVCKEADCCLNKNIKENEQIHF